MGLVFTGSTFFLLSGVTFLLAMAWSSSLLSSLLSLTTFSDLDAVNEQTTPWMNLNMRLAIPCFPGSDGVLTVPSCWGGSRPLSLPSFFTISRAEPAGGGVRPFRLCSSLLSCSARTVRATSFRSKSFAFSGHKGHLLFGCMHPTFTF